MIGTGEVDYVAGHSMPHAAGQSRINRWQVTPMRVALLYIVFGVLWILFSDHIVAVLIEDRPLLDTVQTAKGWFFVAFSGATIYLLTAAITKRAEHPDAGDGVVRPLRFLHRHSTHVAVAVLVLGVLLSIFAWLEIRRREYREARGEFTSLAEERIDNIADEAQGAVERLEFLATFFQSSENVTRDEFDAFASRILAARRYFWRITWNLIVTDKERERLEERARGEGLADFAIRERTSDRGVAPVEARPEHVVVWYAVTGRGEGSPLGLDLMASLERSEALLHARDFGDARVTSPTTLFADEQSQQAVSVYKAVYTHRNSRDVPKTDEDRRARLMGYVGVSFRVSDFLQEALRTLRDTEVELSIFDAANPGERVAFHSPSSPAGLPGPAVGKAPVSLEQVRRRSRNLVEREVHVAGRTWLVLCAPESGEIASPISEAALLIPLGGLVGSLLMSMYIASLGSLALSERAAARSAAALGERSKLLEISEARLRLALSCGRLGVWNVDFSQNTFTSDENHSAIWGLRPDEFTNDPTVYRTRMLPAEFAATQAKVHEATRTRTDYSDSFQILLPDGTVRWAEARGRAEYDDEGKPIRMIGVLADITDRKAAEAAMRKLNENLEARVHARTLELERANSELEAFSYSVSHDLRAPLRAIDGFSRILLTESDQKPESEVRRMLGIIRTNTTRMSTLIDDLLAFSRLGRGEVKRLKVDMAAIVREVKEAVIAPEDARRITFEIGELAICSGDPAMLKQVWVNLMSNAVKFSRATGEARVRIYSPTDAKMPTYIIEDNGVGFDMQYADKLFGVFQRLHRWDEFEGTGVGLAIVKRVIERHGGSIHAKAEVDHGARFEFTVAGAVNESN